MELKKLTSHEATMTILAEEVAFLSSAIGETLEVLEDWEFKTRTGQTRQWAESLLRQLGDILDEMEGPRSAQE
jgi:hypothetical protein